MTDQQWEQSKKESNERFARIETNLVDVTAGLRDVKDGIRELKDAQIVTQRLMELNERRWNERFERLEESHQDGMAELRSSMNSLITNIDRFIQGRQGNGH